ncbi:RNA-binding S4 domain-containing protein [Peptoniphilus catoniae]|uniref:RNA-binding S4 domain-containing protein n=1 Tax=Peptoniphilus catoniae TaxID=1660341 RepID=UPI0010FDE002|nr:RNA-binding S4 domain-containing protein [Peptoniphilus catoniae]
MRIDKFLKVSRIIVRRTVAKNACEAGRVKINSKPAKPGDEVKIGDIIEIAFGNANVSYEVMGIKDHVLKDEADSLYKIVN